MLMRKTMVLSLWGILISSLLVASPVFGEEVALVTDRPDFTESASAAPVGYLQAELGAQVEGDSSFQAVGGPNLLIRTGVIDSILEARFEIPSIAYVKQGDDSFDVDYGSAGLGLKAIWAVTDDFSLAFLPRIAAPVKLRVFQQIGMELCVNGIWAWSINERFSLSGNVVLIFDGVAADETDVSVSYALSVSGGYAVTDRFGVFLESINHLHQGDEYVPMLDGGVTYKITPKFQLDAYVGARIDGPADGWFGGGGLSFLW